MKKLLITGAGGFLGSHLIELAKKRYDVYGFSMNSKVHLPTKQLSYFNLEDDNQLIEKLNEIRPDYIIHCAAISSESGCKQDLELAEKINVDVPIKIKNWCLQNAARLIFTSTDLVFGGDNAPYKEDDIVTPKLIYGQLKLKAERALDSTKGISIVRLPLLYGIGLSERKGLLNHFIEQCKAGNIQTLFKDEFRTPAYVINIAIFLIQLLEINHFGILHLGGKERVSRIELGEMFCKYLDLDANVLKPILRSDIGMEDRPFDTTMNSQQAYKLGFKPNSLEHNLSEVNHKNLK